MGNKEAKPHGDNDQAALDNQVDPRSSSMKARSLKNPRSKHVNNFFTSERNVGRHQEYDNSPGNVGSPTGKLSSGSEGFIRPFEEPRISLKSPSSSEYSKGTRSRLNSDIHSQIQNIKFQNRFSVGSYDSPVNISPRTTSEPIRPTNSLKSASNSSAAQFSATQSNHHYIEIGSPTVSDKSSTGSSFPKQLSIDSAHSFPDDLPYHLYDKASYPKPVPKSSHSPRMVPPSSPPPLNMVLPSNRSSVGPEISPTNSNGSKKGLRVVPMEDTDRTFHILPENELYNSTPNSSTKATVHSLSHTKAFFPPTSTTPTRLSRGQSFASSSFSDGSSSIGNSSGMEGNPLIYASSLVKSSNASIATSNSSGKTRVRIVEVKPAASTDETDSYLSASTIPPFITPSRYHRYLCDKCNVQFSTEEELSAHTLYSKIHEIVLMEEKLRQADKEIVYQYNSPFEGE